MTIGTISQSKWPIIISEGEVEKFNMILVRSNVLRVFLKCIRLSNMLDLFKSNLSLWLMLVQPLFTAPCREGSLLVYRKGNSKIGRHLPLVSIKKCVSDDFKL